jgi:hypothetical protein
VRKAKLCFPATPRTESNRSPDGIKMLGNEFSREKVEDKNWRMELDHLIILLVRLR